MHPRAAAAVCTWFVAAAVLWQPTSTEAESSFHHLSALADSTRSDVVGVASTRWDVRLILDTPAGCDQPFQGWPVYQTQWNVINDYGSWLEIGTGHGCHDYMYWYGGYGSSADHMWHPLYVVNINGQYQQHQFLLRQGTDLRYYWYIDATPMMNYLWDTQGYSAMARLESYDANLQAGSISITSILRFNGPAGGLQSDFPATAQPIVGTAMCFSRISNNSINVGENTPPC